MQIYPRYPLDDSPSQPRWPVFALATNDSAKRNAPYTPPPRHLMHLAGLLIHPVKSLRACPVDAAEVDKLGLAGDRRFMIVDENGRFLTQRTIPRMALVAATLSADALTLTADETRPVTVRRETDASVPRRVVSIWKSDGLLAEDCGETAAAWLSGFLRVRCRLVRIGPEFRRPILKPAVHGTGDVLNFADGCPFLVVSEASLADLNDRLLSQGEDAIPMNRFRPNLVIAGCAAYAEDTWTRFKIGQVTFRAAGPCGRCIVTTTDQFTGERGKEPLRTLATYRRDASDPTDVNFGQNLIHETKYGTIRIGDPVELLE